MTASPGADGPAAPVLAGGVLDDVSPEDLDVPPSLYARFEAFELVGRGGMGAVYRARDVKLDRLVAIKLLAVTSAASRGGILQEARSQARLRHEHACEVFEAGIADHVPFIVMQLIDGAPLSKAKESMTLEEQVLCVRQIAAALHEAHRLGMVHRDVKPGNILVERGGDGACKPTIVDFGLARDVTPDGPTLTAGIQGTPAYMAPEQASGNVQWIDRRTDVYGLGATLYDLLAGRPPFDGASLVDLMRKVIDEEPRPLGRHHPGISQDLAAIVMKSLEKDPSARYPSAKAFGDDLQRFLDGDPVTARAPSWAVVLWKRARRRKGAVALVTGLVVAALLVSGLWLRDLRIAARKAELARELGERTTEMEMFLRTAHGMPLHDVENEREIVRARLLRVEERMAEAPDISEGPGHDALGRGLLALDEPIAALEHFRQAERTGYRSPGLDYAAGVALCALYKKAIDAARRIENEARRRQRIDEIDEAYKVPALARLRAALAHPVAPAAYIEGLIALHEGREEDAVRHAQSAFKEAPWQYEARKLEGDALFARGNRHGADRGELDHDKAMADFERAALAYAAAADLGRSDPTVHRTECELWTKVMNIASEPGAVRPAFERARASCEKAITASPRDATAFVSLAWAHNCFAWWVMANRTEDLTPVLRDATERAAAAAQRAPEEPMAHYVQGAVARTLASDLMDRGRDARPALAAAVAGYEAALRLDPDFVWARSELCSSFLKQGIVESLHGKDPAKSFAAAATHCERAGALDPGFLYARVNLLHLSLSEAEHLLRAGVSPEAPVARGLAQAAALQVQSPAASEASLFRVRLLRVRALAALASGGDEQTPIAEAESVLAGRGPGSPAWDQLRGLVSSLKAQSALARGGDAEGPGREARAALARAVEAAPLEAEIRLWLAEAHLLAFRLAAPGPGAAAALDAAFEAVSALRGPPLSPPGGAPLDDARAFVALAEIHAARAGAWPRDERRREGEIEQGITEASTALALSPGSGGALSVLERLRRLRAR